MNYNLKFLTVDNLWERSMIFNRKSRTSFCLDFLFSLHKPMISGKPCLRCYFWCHGGDTTLQSSSLWNRYGGKNHDSTYTNYLFHMQHFNFLHQPKNLCQLTIFVPGFCFLCMCMCPPHISAIPRPIIYIIITIEILQHLHNICRDKCNFFKIKISNFGIFNILNSDQYMKNKNVKKYSKTF